MLFQVSLLENETNSNENVYKQEYKSTIYDAMIYWVVILYSLIIYSC